MDSGRIRVVSKARQPIPQCFLIRPWRGRVQPAIRKDMACKPTICEQRCCLIRRLPISGRVKSKDILDLVCIRGRKWPAGAGGPAKGGCG